MHYFILGLAASIHSMLLELKAGRCSVLSNLGHFFVILDVFLIEIIDFFETVVKKTLFPSPNHNSSYKKCDFAVGGSRQKS